MTATLRKGGSMVALQWAAGQRVPHPSDPPFCEALAERRFRTIENAASEEVSVGWVTPADPTGSSHDLEDIDAGAGIWLRVRIDKKALPSKWVQDHIDAAEKAKGKRLSARERRELKADLAEKLLPRVLPTTTKLDALVFHNRRLVLLFTGSKGGREAFTKLWHETFGVPLDLVGCAALARGAGIDEAALEKVEPTRWPVAAGGAS